MSAISIHSEFDLLLKDLGLQEDIFPLVQKVFDRVWAREMKSVKKDEDNGNDIIRVLEKKIDDVMDMALNARSEGLRSTYEHKIESLGNELRSLQNKQATTKNIDFDIPYRTALEKSMTMLKSPYKIWTSLTFDEKHKLFYFIFQEKLRYSRTEGYRTTKSCCYIRLFEQFDASNSPHVEMGGIEPPCKKEISQRLHI